ncbi:MAG: efflux RND transporter permease subunit, partial [Planctomycetota bacterium]
QYRNVDEVGRQIIREEEGRPIYISDVAEVRVGYQKPTGTVKRYGMETLSISVTRENGGNSIDVVRGLDEKVEKLNESVLARKGLILNKVYDETVYINSAVGLVKQNIMLGGSLTVIVLMIFLHLRSRTLVIVPIMLASSIAAITISPWFFAITILLILVSGAWFARGTLVVAMAIPTSIIGTFLILNLLGRSLNVISLAGLSFAVGMLVDNAVVVLENIYRYRQLGQTAGQASLNAVKEVWGAVLASTLTTLAVFLPVIFLQGEAGQLFMDIALAISAAVGLSLIVSVIVIPTASARMIGDAAIESDSKPGKFELWLQGFGTRFTEMIVGFNNLIQKTVIGRLAVVAAILAIAFGTAYVLMPEIEYLPAGNRNLVFARILPPPSYNVNQLASMGAEVEEVLRPYWDIDPETEDTSELDFPAIADYFFVARGNSVFVGLRAYEALEARQLIDMVKTKLGKRFPGAFVTASQSSLFGRGLGGGRDIDIEIQGPELEKLVDIGGTMIGLIKGNFPSDTQARPNPSLDLSSTEVHVRPKPEQANALGITNQELGYVVNTLIDGAYATDYFLGGEKIDLVLLGAKSYDARKQDLEQQYIATRNSIQPVRLGSVANIEYGSGPEQVVRRERERAITIEVSPPDEISLEQAIRRIQTDVVGPLVDEGVLGGDYQVNLSGTADKLAQTWEALRWNFLLAILITYLLMAALFESWVYPFVIILSVPMGAVGGIIGLKGLGYFLAAQGEPLQSLDVLTMLGFVILVGTVVNNAILIVHQSLVHIREGQDSNTALSNSIRNRIRPIFMTTMTTVFGLSPLVLFPGAGSELYRGLGSVVLGGLLLSTFFTLVLVPTLFSLMIDLKAWVSRMFRKPAAA